MSEGEFVITGSTMKTLKECSHQLLCALHLQNIVYRSWIFLELSSLCSNAGLRGHNIIIFTI